MRVGISVFICKLLQPSTININRINVITMIGSYYIIIISSTINNIGGYCSVSVGGGGHIILIICKSSSNCMINVYTVESVTHRGRVSNNDSDTINQDFVDIIASVCSNIESNT